MNPNQMRYYGIDVNDNPFAQPVYIHAPDTTGDVGSLTIPLEIKGTTLFWNSRTPTQQEIDTCPRIVFVFSRTMGSTER